MNREYTSTYLTEQQKQQYHINSLNGPRFTTQDESIPSFKSIGYDERERRFLLLLFIVCYVYAVT